ncbi:MAG: choloylglycine hydrolase family protein [Verrucomicrobia bacterium]|nr:choloylglycine hydrolase family protein [Verrucomicrobiota bacterium]
MFVYISLFFSFFLSSLLACTAFQLKAKDGSLLYGRSMEFGFRMSSDLLVVSQGAQYIGTAPEGQPGLKWTVKYGFVGMNQVVAKTIVSDGMNEKGLIAALLYLPGFTQYENPDPGRLDRTLGAWEVATYLLSTCSTVGEAKTALTNILVAQEPTPELGNFIIPLHFYITDLSGAVLIVEYIGGIRYFYDNPLGVLTNSPPFDWHLSNLSNYINLSPTNVPSLQLSNWTIRNPGQGSGLLGLPGDYTPASRFVRAALFSQWADAPKTAIDGVNTCFHILNSLDIFAGIIRTQTSEHNNTSLPTNDGLKKLIGADITEWVVVHDRANLKTYFRTYEGLKIQMVDLKKIDFTIGRLQTIPLAKDFLVEDITAQAKPLSSL